MIAEHGEPAMTPAVGEPEWTPEQVEAFNAEFGRRLSGAHPVCWHESAMRVRVVPEIDKEVLLEAVLEVITGTAVVKPGETLVIRLKDWPPYQVEYYQEDLNRRGLPFRVLAVVGDELAVAKPEPVSGDPFADKAAQRGG